MSSRAITSRQLLRGWTVVQSGTKSTLRRPSAAVRGLGFSEFSLTKCKTSFQTWISGEQAVVYDTSRLLRDVEEGKG